MRRRRLRFWKYNKRVYCRQLFRRSGMTKVVDPAVRDRAIEHVCKQLSAELGDEKLEPEMIAPLAAPIAGVRVSVMLHYIRELNVRKKEKWNIKMSHRKKSERPQSRVGLHPEDGPVWKLYEAAV